jgi:hypothetical protein
VRLCFFERDCSEDSGKKLVGSKTLKSQHAQQTNYGSLLLEFRQPARTLFDSGHGGESGKYIHCIGFINASRVCEELTLSCHG